MLRASECWSGVSLKSARRGTSACQSRANDANYCNIPAAPARHRRDVRRLPGPLSSLAAADAAAAARCVAT